MRHAARLAIVMSVAWATLALGAEEPAEGPIVGPPLRQSWTVPTNLVVPLPQLIDHGQILVVAKAKNAPGTVSLLNTADGHVIWTTEIKQDLKAANIAGDVLLLGLIGSVKAVTLADGTTLWEQPANPSLDSGWSADADWFKTIGYGGRSIFPLTNGNGIGGSLAVAGDRLAIVVNGTVYGVDVHTGKALWQYNARSPLTYPIQVLGDRFIVATMYQGLGALSPADGHVLWGVKVDRAVPLVVGDELYIAQQFPKDETARVDPDTGKAIWTAKYTGDSAMRGYAVGDRVVLHSDRAGVAILSRADGKIHYQATSSLSHCDVRDGVLIYVDRDKFALAGVNVATAQPLWAAKPPLGHGPPLVVGFAGERALAVDPPSFTCRAPGDGAVLWQQMAPPGQLWNDAVWDTDARYLYAVTGFGLYRFALDNGSCTLAYRLRMPQCWGVWIRGGQLMLHGNINGAERLVTYALPAEG